jgi:hypothetical protein
VCVCVCVCVCVVVVVVRGDAEVTIYDVEFVASFWKVFTCMETGLRIKFCPCPLSLLTNAAFKCSLLYCRYQTQLNLLTGSAGQSRRQSVLLGKN